MNYIEPTPAGVPQPEIKPSGPAGQPEIQPAATPEELPQPVPGGGDPGDSRPHDSDA